MNRFANRRALVTGAARGIGRAIAERLHDEGAQVVAVDLDDVVTPAGWVAFRFDLADVESVGDLVATVEDTVGALDVVVNCAAVPATQGVLDLTTAQLQHVLRVNLEAPIMLAASAARRMVARGYGRILNVTSVHAGRGVPGCVAYDASKAGLENATRSLAVELAARGVLVNALAPGFVDTRLADLETAEYREVYLRHGRLPIARAARPDEIAALAAWLTSTENSYVTGAVVTADGGLTATL